MNVIVRLIRKFINWIRTVLANRLVKLRSRLRMNSLREAIGKADDDKAKTGRKNIVVFNNHSGAYEPLQKKLMKTAHRVQKGKGQPTQTKYRKKHRKELKPSRFTNDRIHQLENKSAYVTK